MIWQSNVSRFGRAGGFCWVIQSTSSSTAWRAMSARGSCVFVRGWGHVGGEGHVVKAENRQIAAYGQARFGGGEIDALCGAVTKAEHGSGRIRHRPQRHTRSSGPESALRSAFARWAAWPFRVNPRERVALCTHAIQHQTKGVFGGRPWNRTRRGSPRRSYSPLPHLAARRPMGGWIAVLAGGVKLEKSERGPCQSALSQRRKGPGRLECGQ